jgi:hypothetical protein
MMRLVTGIISPDSLETILADINQDTRLDFEDLLVL